jgi:hypothetical protein
MFWRRDSYSHSNRRRSNQVTQPSCAFVKTSKLLRYSVTGNIYIPLCSTVVLFPPKNYFVCANILDLHCILARHLSLKYLLFESEYEFFHLWRPLSVRDGNGDLVSSLESVCGGVDHVFLSGREQAPKLAIGSGHDGFADSFSMHLEYNEKKKPFQEMVFS